MNLWDLMGISCVGTYGNSWELNAWELMGTYGNLWELLLVEPKILSQNVLCVENLKAKRMLF